MEIKYRLVFYKDALKAINKIDKILKVLEQDPFHPTPGEPETLKYTTGYSRRINKKDRITYDINEAAKEVVIFRMRGHYDDK